MKITQIPKDESSIPRINEIVKEKCTSVKIEEKPTRIIFTLPNGKYFIVFYCDMTCCTNQYTTSLEIVKKHGQRISLVK